MTNSPEERTPDLPRMTTEPEPLAAATGTAAQAPEPAAGATDPVAAADVLDRDTYDEIREPRPAGRLPLGDGTWHQLARQYVWVQLISTGVVALIVLAAVLFVTLVWGQWWAWIPGGIFLAILTWTLIITPRQARAYGYQLRRDDLVFRRGILWQRVVAVPYGRMQLVDITHGPLDRGFGIAQLKLVTAAASTGVVIPGLRQEAAEQLRDTLVDVAEARRTGL
jgi:membrane protein YdbS with pleckstrin-like domain